MACQKLSPRYPKVQSQRIQRRSHPRAVAVAVGDSQPAAAVEVAAAVLGNRLLVSEPSRRVFPKS